MTTPAGAHRASRTADGTAARFPIDMALAIGPGIGHTLAVLHHDSRARGPRAPRHARPQTFLHRHATFVQVALTISLYAQFALLAGLAATPGVYAALRVWEVAGAWPLVVKVFVACSLGWGAYFAYTVCLIFVVGGFRFLTRAEAPVGRFRFYSYAAYRWARYNALILLVRYTCLNFMRVTPFLTLFHRVMGMRIGRRVQINTAVIGDSNLIEIGDDTVIGGDVTLVAHTAAHGVFVTAPVRIGRGVTVGLMAVILPGVVIGDGAVVLPNSVIEAGTRVGPGEVWGGSPARCVRTRPSDAAARGPDGRIDP